MGFVFHFTNMVYYIDDHKLLVHGFERILGPYSNTRPLIPSRRTLYTMGSVIITENILATQLNLLSSNAIIPSVSSQRTSLFCLKTSNDGELTS